MIPRYPQSNYTMLHRTIVACLVSLGATLPVLAQTPSFFKQHCTHCHDADAKEGGLDLMSLGADFGNTASFHRWVKIHDRIESGQMPPIDEPRPSDAEKAKVLSWLKTKLVQAELDQLEDEPRTKIRRLTRVEYENTVRDLFDMPGLQLRDLLPADGSAHGFDRNSDALSISHVNMARYIEAADLALDFAIATQPDPPTFHKRRLSLTSHYYVRLLINSNGGAVLLKDKKPDPEFLPVDGRQHIDHGLHERMGMFDTDSAVGVFRHEDESFLPWTQGFAAIYPGRYRVRASLWSYTWDKGVMKPARGVEAMRLSVKQLQGRGLGQDHPSYVIGYYAASSLESQQHEFVHWLNPGESIGFNVASLAPVHIYHQYKRNLYSFTGPGIACDWIDIEGPIHDVWPPHAHRVLFGDLPLKNFDPNTKDVTYPRRTPPRQAMVGAKNQADANPGNWTVHSDEQLADARRLLSEFLPKAFRRPVEPETIDAYKARVAARLEAGDCFELAMRWAYRAALCSPDFLYHVEPVGELDDFALASRLSYFLWNSMPDQRLTTLATEGQLRRPDVLHAEVERCVADSKFNRFVKDFCGQWLRLREIAATDPDRRLYPEFSSYLQDSMVLETEAFFRELIDRNLDASHLVESDFAMLNEKLATHYGIDGVSGPEIRRVELPPEHPRGPFLTQASILKITANGTTTSPVPRGAFVLDRLLGQPSDPPPPDVPAVEPDVRGATTIREQLALHRDNAACAACHANLDPPGFAMESFDVIGGQRTRYRSIGEGDKAPRGSIDPFINISFKLGPNVDPAGALPDGRSFGDIREFQQLATADTTLLLTNMARQFAIYSTGSPILFSDRAAVKDIVTRVQKQGGGLRTLIHEVIASPLFTSSAEVIPTPASMTKLARTESADAPRSKTLTSNLPDVTSPVSRTVAPAEEPAPREFQFSAEDTVTLRTAGLFMPERVEDLRSLMHEFPEARLLKFDFQTATATFGYSDDSDLFRNAKPEQVVERLNNRIRQLSRSTIGVKTPGTLPHEMLQLIEIPIFGLDCKACSLAVHDILVRIDGVEHATASFHDGRARAWIDPVKTNRTRLEEALKQGEVAISE